MADQTAAKATPVSLWPNWPVLVWMILITLLIGLVAGFSAGEIISTFNSGWGYAAGEFALILLPSFAIAAAIDRQKIEVPQTLSVGFAPVAGAGMICPDTAYAALSPMVQTRKLSLAFGAYAGFKLLFPAGPLIVATSLGVADARLLAYCAAIFAPVWAAGLIFGRVIERRLGLDSGQTGRGAGTASLELLWPFALLAGLLACGALMDLAFSPWLDFATNPKGALLLTAAAALGMVPAGERRGCIDAAIRRTGSLLLIIGAASAFSAFVTAVVPVAEIFTAQNGAAALLTLFAMTALFKLLQGSSMSTFAAAGPVAVPIVAASQVSPVAAVLAVCLGSFVAILPNDSFYWLVRRSALAGEREMSATAILAGGSVLQAFLGLALLLTLQGLALI
ncbi:arsinothricin export permease ArsQ [Cribrihabitans neustonicus]|uniref:arsinothricin export permease ArsQ n=1 Tax=Cribrihabitans neustonicus TaxID=1429085 RepID=UPI003B5BED16